MEKNMKKERLNVYNWVTLPYSRDCHSIVNQLYFNLKKVYDKYLYIKIFSQISDSFLEVELLDQRVWAFIFKILFKTYCPKCSSERV